MLVTFKILRQKQGEKSPYTDYISFDCEDLSKETVATALEKINAGVFGSHEDGSEILPIRWECSCMQKKCGACAMVIDGRPGLACDFYLSKHKGKGPVTIEPLKKFPVIEDLYVDRSIMRKNLLIMKSWMEEGRKNQNREAYELSYEGSKCLQCGCCLEVCPNFCPGDTFFGMAASIPVTRLISSMDESEAAALKKAYKEHIFNGCGKSLACRDVCPAGIDVEHTLSSMNRSAVWRHK